MDKVKNKEIIERFYWALYRIRRVEEEIARIFPSDKIKSPIHLSIGQESISVAVSEALRSDDVVFGTYRGHALYLAKGGSLKKMIAELFGKKAGCAKGKGGSMHMVDAEKGVMGTSAIVGTTIPLSVGYAYSLKFNRTDAVAVSFFGDGAVDEGAFHESLNFAALKGLPALFICENNQYAIHSHHLARHHSDNICERVRAYGIPAERIEEDDIFGIHKTAQKYIDRIRQNNGPAFLECFTCRWKEHVGPNDDFHLGYRTEEEVNHWKERDQLKRLRELMETDCREEMEERIEREIKDAFAYADACPFPGPEDLYEDLFKE